MKREGKTDIPSFLVGHFHYRHFIPPHSALIEIRPNKAICFHVALELLQRF
jgi:hypothetical protein